MDKKAKKKDSATASFFMTILVLICIATFIGLMYIFWPYSVAVLCCSLIFVIAWAAVHNVMYGDPYPPEDI